MKRSPRDRMLLLVLPALTIFVGYTFTIQAKQRREIAAKHNLLDKERASTVTKAQVAAEQARQRYLQSQVFESERHIAVGQRQFAELAQQLLGVGDVNSTIGEVTQRFTAHGLHIEEAVAADKPDAVLSPSLRKVVERLKTQPGFRAPRVYRLKFVGRYCDVGKALERLVADDVALPVQLYMAEADLNVKWRRWTLFIWV